MDPIAIAKAAWGLITSPLGKLILITILAGSLWARGTHYQHQRDALKGWQDDVTQAAREASHRPKLAVKNVAQQVRYLGQDLDTVRAAMERAKAKAMADKLLIDNANEQRRKDANNALRQDAISDRRRADDYRSTHRVRRAGAPQLGEPAGSDDGVSYLPEPGFAAGVADGAGADAFVAISPLDYNACTENSRRLLNAHKWAVPVDTTPKPAD